MTERANTTCDCTHQLRHHYKGGQCEQCACTWWHPNARLVARRRKAREYYLVMRRYRAIDRLKRMKRRRRR